MLPIVFLSCGWASESAARVVEKVNNENATVAAEPLPFFFCTLTKTHAMYTGRGPAQSCCLSRARLRRPSPSGFVGGPSPALRAFPTRSHSTQNARPTARPFLT